MAFEEFFNPDGIFAEDEVYVLRRLQEEDKEPFMQLLVDISDIKDAYNNRDFYEYSWVSSLNDEEVLNLSLLERESGSYLGYLTVRDPYSENPELGCDIVKEFRRKGIAYQAIQLLIRRMKDLKGTRVFKIKAYVDNVASLNLIRKLDGVEVGREDNEFISILSKSQEMIGGTLPEEDDGPNQEVIKEFADRYFRVFEIRI